MFSIIDCNMKLALLITALFLIGCGNAKVIKVEIEAGSATITDRGTDSGEISHLKLKCNNGLIINADWKRNPYNEFGYDLYEPTVSEDTNRLAVMLLVRGVIANYLNGYY